MKYDVQIMGFNRKKWLIGRFYDNYDPVERERLARDLLEAKLRAAGLRVPKRGRTNSQA
jgi:hypothetical protein